MKAWADSLGKINYPLLSDFWPHGAVSKLYGVLRGEGYSERALIIIDRNGVIRYIDIHDIDNQPSNEVLRKELLRIDPELKDSQPAEQPKQADDLPQGGIVMYCTKWCSDCRNARDWLKSHNLEFTEVDIYAHPLAAQKVREWAGGKQITPTFDIDGVIIIDFDVEKLSEVLRGHISG